MRNMKKLFIGIMFIAVAGYGVLKATKATKEIPPLYWPM